MVRGPEGAVLFVGSVGGRALDVVLDLSRETGEDGYAGEGGEERCILRCHCFSERNAWAWDILFERFF